MESDLKMCDSCRFWAWVESQRRYSPACFNGLGVVIAPPDLPPLMPGLRLGPLCGAWYYRTRERNERGESIYRRGAEGAAR